MDQNKGVVMTRIIKTVINLLTGCGNKKLKLCGFWEANCAVKNGDCAGLRNRLNKQIFDYRAQKKTDMVEFLGK